MTRTHSQQTAPRPIGAWALGAALATLGAALPAQVWPLTPYQEDPSTRQYWEPPPAQWQSQQSPLSPRSTLGPALSPSLQGMFDNGFELYSDTTGLGFPGVEATYPLYPTYPRYPAGYGPRPQRGGYLPGMPVDEQGFPIPQIRPQAEPRGDGWPSWIETGDEERAATPERGVVARTAERVWVLTPDEPAFIPLAFWDKFRVVESGSVVEVRNKGEFQVSFHDAALLRSRGPCRVGLPALSAELAELQFITFRRVWLYSKARPFKILLPDGSLLALADAEIYMERVGGRGHIHNHGPSDIQLVTRSGTVDVSPGRRVDVFLEAASKPYLPATLSFDGAVTPERKGKVIELRGEGDGGTVTWSGARFRVPGDVTVRIDALAGTGFPENQPQ